MAATATRHSQHARVLPPLDYVRLLLPRLLRLLLGLRCAPPPAAAAPPCCLFARGALLSVRPALSPAQQPQRLADGRQAPSAPSAPVAPLVLGRAGRPAHAQWPGRGAPHLTCGQEGCAGSGSLRLQVYVAELFMARNG